MYIYIFMEFVVFRWTKINFKNDGPRTIMNKYTLINDSLFD